MADGYLGFLPVYKTTGPYRIVLRGKKNFKY